MSDKEEKKELDQNPSDTLEELQVENELAEIDNDIMKLEVEKEVQELADLKRKNESLKKHLEQKQQENDSEDEKIDQIKHNCIQESENDMLSDDQI